MDLGLEARVALVMGASRGIGRGIAAALAREGARVAIASRSHGRLKEAAAEIGEGATPFVADATDLERLAQELRQLSEQCRGGTIAECRILDALSPEPRPSQSVPHEQS